MLDTKLLPFGMKKGYLKMHHLPELTLQVIKGTLCTMLMFWHAESLYINI